MEFDWIRGNEIGRGSFATINFAIPTKNSAPPDHFPPLMAVKSSDSFSSSLHNEKQILHLLGDCPQIIQCFGDDSTFENGEEFYNLFLEYASGGSLADEIQRRGGRLSESDCRRYTRTILEGLQFIHGKGFVHCDLKPRNILLLDDNNAKIADFGLSKRVGKNRAEKTEFRGSPLYMSPESVNENEYEPPCDIWALGCVVVEMLNGKPAWNFRPESNIYSLLLRIGMGEELPEIPKDLSEEGKDFLEKCFVRDPKKRWSAEMLMNHPFVEEIGSFDLPLKASISPRCPFDFEEWSSVHSLEIERGFVSSSSSSSSSPTERLLRLVENRRFDWSVSDSWVTVR